MSEWPPLPADDADLEELLSEHVETITPPPALVERTQAAVRGRVDGGAGLRWAAAGGAVLALVGMTLLLMPGDEEPVPPPPTPTRAPSPTVTASASPAPAPPPTTPSVVPSPTVTAEPAPRPTPPPVKAEELVIPLQGKPEAFAADENYDLLHKQLAAPLIVTGRVELTKGKTDSAVLRVDQVLRGNRAALLRITAAGNVNACEGVPDFTRYGGKDVVMFLRVGRNGATTQLLHGGSSVRALPYHDLLSGSDLAAVLSKGRIPTSTLTALVQRRGPRVLTRLTTHFRQAANSFTSAAVQVALGKALQGFSADPARADLMPIARYLSGAPALSGTAIQRLKAHEGTFRAKLGVRARLSTGEWVDNGYRHHVTYLRFVARYDLKWAVRSITQSIRMVRATQPRSLYQSALNLLQPPAALGSLKATLTARGTGGVFELEGKAPRLPNGTLLHVALTFPEPGKRRPVEAAFFMVRVDMGVFRARKVYKAARFAPLVYEARADLVLSSQRRAIREFIRRDFGLPKDGRLVVGRQRIVVGTPVEQASFVAETLHALKRFVAALESDHTAVALQHRTGGDPQRKLPKLLVKTSDRINAHLSQYVAWCHHDLIRRLKTSQGELGWTARAIRRGKLEKAGRALTRIANELRSLRTEIDRRLAR